MAELSLNPHKTIAAIATAPGEGGIAVIRISGSRAIEVGAKIFSGDVASYASHTVHFGSIMENSQEIDQGLLLVMRAPRSYTGEDTVEIHCHGGSLIARRVLEAALKAGAEPAGPGEFTYQAFMNGKIDLAQAEGVGQLIGAKNDLSLKAAGTLLSGRLSQHIKSLQEELIDHAATLEASVDFPDEGLEYAKREEILASVKSTLGKMEHLENTFHEGKKIVEGLHLCLVGRPNAGKSSLMNALLGVDRSIVTEIPGTTRDLIEAEMLLGGLHVQLTDTAGIRQTTEVIEQEGIRRSKKALAEADLILLIIDVSAAYTEEDEALLSLCDKEKTVIVWNKMDLPSWGKKEVLYPHQVFICAKTGEGIEGLKKEVQELIWEKGAPSKEEIVLTNIRHKEALQSAISDLKALIAGLQTGISSEFLGADMRSALLNLSSIIGIDITEDILSAIFAKFCVGK